MARSRNKKTLIKLDGFEIEFHFPKPTKPPTLREEAARVVDMFIGTLDIESNARTVALEVSAEGIKIHRRNGRTPSPGAIMVPLDSFLCKARERFLAIALSDQGIRRHLWTVADAAAGNDEIRYGDLHLSTILISGAVSNVGFKLTG